jgi:hypothetical protein
MAGLSKTDVSHHFLAMPKYMTALLQSISTKSKHPEHERPSTAGKHQDNVLGAVSRVILIEHPSHFGTAFLECAQNPLSTCTVSSTFQHFSSRAKVFSFKLDTARRNY